MHTHSSITDRRATFYSAAIVLGWIIIVVALTRAQDRPPAAVPAGATATDFSAERAMQQVPALAREPHWIGSAGNMRVRDQLLSDLTALGVKPEVQRATVYRLGSLANVENVVARLDGTANTKAILVVVHYDAVPTSPGASYEGVAAAMLETLRGLKAGPPLRNNVIFLFTDAEEIGLHGAQAFLDEHPWSKEVGLVLAYIPRGDAGVVSVFNTGPDNAWLIQQLKQATRYPVANSLENAVSGVTPYHADFEVFSKAGLPGLNFGFIDNQVHYHAMTDTPGNLDPRSIQQIGSDSLPLIRQLGNLDLSSPHSGDAIFFNPWGWSVLAYPATWAGPVMVVVALVVLGVLGLGFGRHRLTAGIVWGWLAFLGLLVVAILFVEGVWLAVDGRLNLPLIWGNTYNSGWYELALVCLSLAITAALYILLRRRLRWENLAGGALLWWLILALASTLFLPGTSYVMVWPLLFSSLGLGLLFGLGDAAQDWWKRTLVLCLTAVPALVLMSQLVHAIFVLQGVSMSPPAIFLAMLLLGLLIPQLEALVKVRPAWLPLAGLLVGAIFMAVGVTSYRADSSQPRADFVRYVLNADTQRAIWFTDQDRTDAWTAQFFPNGITSGPIGDVLPYEEGNAGRAQAPVVALDPPHADLLEDRTANGVRSLRLRISSARHAPLISIFVDPKVQVRSATLNGKQLDLHSLTPVNYYAFPSEGAELDLTVAAGQPVRLDLVDQTQGLPQIGGKAVPPRPANLIPVPAGDLSYVSDTTLVVKSFAFGPPG